MSLFVSVLIVGDLISLRTLNDYFFGNDLSRQQYLILHEIRIPKAVMATLVGAALALSGYLMQQLVNNPLADPYLISTASGASLGVNLTISGVLPVLGSYIFALPLYGFLFGLTSTLLVVFISRRKGEVNTLLLVIAGVSVSSLLTACTSLIVYYSDTASKLRSILFWAMGSFEKAQRIHLPYLAVVLVLVLILTFMLHRHMIMLLLGIDKARTLGVKIERLQLLLLLLSTVLVGVAVAFCGPIGFVGLIVPHFSRAFMGVTSRYVLPFTALLGAVFMLSCELIAQLAVPVVGLPVGVVSSFIGVPFFLYLLFHKKYRFGS